VLKLNLEADDGAEDRPVSGDVVRSEVFESPATQYNAVFFLTFLLDLILLELYAVAQGLFYTKLTETPFSCIRSYARKL